MELLREVEGEGKAVGRRGHHWRAPSALPRRGGEDHRRVRRDGSLIGEPLRLVKAETVDVPVPADAEIVLEGRITLAEEDEGPFTEYSGYLSGRSTRNVFEVGCVTMRRDAVYQTIMPSNSDEHLLLSGLPKQARIFGAVSAFSPMPAVRDMSWPVSGTHYVCLVSMEGRREGAGVSPSSSARWCSASTHT